jgi:hypothetical protein
MMETKLVSGSQYLPGMKLSLVPMAAKAQGG